MPILNVNVALAAAYLAVVAHVTVAVIDVPAFIEDKLFNVTVVPLIELPAVLLLSVTDNVPPWFVFTANVVLDVPYVTLLFASNVIYPVSFVIVNDA